MLYILGTSHLFYGYFFTNVYKTYGMRYINDDHFLTLVGSISSLFNGFFKFMWATLLDYYPFKRIYGFLICLEIGMIVAITYAVHNRYAFMMVSCLTYMCDGSLTSMIPAVTLSQFGLVRGPQVYGYMYSIFAMSCLLSIFFVFVVKPYISFNGIFFVSGCFSTIALICTYLLKERRVFDYVKVYEE